MCFVSLGFFFETRPSFAATHFLFLQFEFESEMESLAHDISRVCAEFHCIRFGRLHRFEIHTQRKKNLIFGEFW